MLPHLPGHPPARRTQVLDPTQTVSRGEGVWTGVEKKGAIFHSEVYVSNCHRSILKKGLPGVKKKTAKDELPSM